MRLTKDIKAEILAAALVKSGVPELEAAIRARYAAWIEAVRVREITPEVDQQIRVVEEAYSKLPESLQKGSSIVRKNSDIQVNVAGQNRKHYWCGADSYKSVVNYEYRVTSGVATLTADDPLVQQLYDIDADSAKAADKRASITAAVNAYLNAATTIKALLKLWPECKPLIPTAASARGVNLPSVPVADLNKLVGLP